ncbi:MAG: hypothetical protein ACI9QL_005173 [Candidatus Omnitrophota bacterium]|jgi:hypothetical protein
MQHTVLIIDDNIRFLEQGIQLLKGVADEDYVRVAPPLYSNGVGGHFRHCLDHYVNLLNGIDSSVVDYDARARELEIETNRTYAIRCIGDLIDRLKALPEDAPERALSCKMDCGSEDTLRMSGSSVRRELQFLISHTVHHYALIAMMLRHQGIEPHPDFGVAPSTLRYRESQLQCAQ